MLPALYSVKNLKNICQKDTSACPYYLSTQPTASQVLCLQKQLS